MQAVVVLHEHKAGEGGAAKYSVGQSNADGVVPAPAGVRNSSFGRD